VIFIDVMEAIKGRRSIRRYRPDPGGDETVEMVLEAAR
jgi:nitroreductase